MCDSFILIRESCLQDKMTVNLFICNILRDSIYDLMNFPEIDVIIAYITSFELS